MDVHFLKWVSLLAYGSVCFSVVCGPCSNGKTPSPTLPNCQCQCEGEGGGNIDRCSLNLFVASISESSTELVYNNFHIQKIFPF